jgi:hypothetical protein
VACSTLFVRHAIIHPLTPMVQWFEHFKARIKTGLDPGHGVSGIAISDKSLFLTCYLQEVTQVARLFSSSSCTRP